MKKGYNESYTHMDELGEKIDEAVADKGLIERAMTDALPEISAEINRRLWANEYENMSGEELVGRIMNEANKLALWKK